MSKIEMLSLQLEGIVIDTICSDNIKGCVSQIRNFIDNVDMSNDDYLHIPLTFIPKYINKIVLLDSIRVSTTGKTIEFNRGIAKTDMLASVIKM